MKIIISLIFIFSCCHVKSQGAISPAKEVNMHPVKAQSSVPKPKAPADLFISDIAFIEAPGKTNNMLDVDETAQISFNVKNNGKGTAYQVAVVINTPTHVTGIVISTFQPIGTLTSGQQTVVTIPVYGSTKLESGKVNFELVVTEANHFYADPFNVSFSTQAYKSVNVIVADHQFFSVQEGKLTLGQPVTLDVILQNQGQIAENDITVEFVNPQNVFSANETLYKIPLLQPNETKKISYEFFANKKYESSEIPIKIIIRARHDTLINTISARLEQFLFNRQHLNIEGVPGKSVQITPVTLTSDVDGNIPVNETISENRYALIIGNEDYSSYQPTLSNEVNVSYASRDARTFKEYCNKTLGVPESNITLIINATTGQMFQALDKLNKLIKVTKGKAEVIVYYAGHGLPDEVTKEPYIIPVDQYGGNLTSALKLSDLYAKLTEFPSSRVCVFLDACFSGGARGQNLVTTRGVKIIPTEQYLKGNLVVFNAGSKEQSALCWHKQEHGMFTYFLLRQLKDSRGEITLGELVQSVTEKVEVESLRSNNREQSPSLIYSEDVKNFWKNWKLK